MAVIDKDAANKASQDKSQDKKTASNQAKKPLQEPSQDDLTSVQGIAKHSFDSSYAVVDRVIRESSKAGVEQAIADYRSQVECFERSFNKDFLHKIREEKETQSYEIGESVMRLLTQSGANALPSSQLIAHADVEATLSPDQLDQFIARLLDRKEFLSALDIDDPDRDELDDITEQLKELGAIE